MLRRRLNVSGPLLAALLIVGAACGGDDTPDAGELDVVAPDVTAVDADTARRCDAAADALRDALAEFESAEGSPAESEAALVATGYLDEESELFDVVDGQLLAVANGCKGAVPVTTPDGSAPVSAPATDLGQILTEDEPITASEVYDAMTPDDVTEFGGEACARELADIFAAGERFVAREGRPPDSLADLAGDLEGTVSLWVLDEAGEVLVPADGSPCPDVLSDP